MSDLPQSDSSLDERLQAIAQRASTSREEPAQHVRMERPIELLAWSSATRVYDPKTPQWYLGLFAIGVIGVVAFAIIQEPMLILLTAALVFVYYAMARVEPQEADHIILSTGIKSAGRMYLWSELKSFWVYQERGANIVRIDTKMHFPHALELLLAEVEPKAAEDALVKFLPEVEKAPSEAGAMADHALVSVANKIPFRRQMLHWIENATGTRLSDNPH